MMQPLVRSRRHHCSIVWGGIDQHLCKLQRVLTFTARVIYSARKLDPVTPLLKRLKWLTLENRLQLNTACFICRAANESVFSELAQLFTEVKEGSESIIRLSNKFLVLPTNLNESEDPLHAGAVNCGIIIS